MDTIFQTISVYLSGSGFGQFHWSNGVMLLVGLLFLFLAIRKGFEPLLLVPIGFGILIGNIPYDASKLPLSVYDGPVSDTEVAYYSFDPELALVEVGDEAMPFLDAVGEHGGGDAATHVRFMRTFIAADVVRLNQTVERIDNHNVARSLVEEGLAFMANERSLLVPRRDPVENAIVHYGQGRAVVTLELEREDSSGELERITRFPELWSIDDQDPKNASVFWWLFAGVGLAGFYPPLIFLGIGALTDFGPMLSNPKTLLLGAAAQFGIFGSLLGALWFGFDLKEAASIGIIGGADGPTAIFTCSQLAPDLLGAVALAAYSYMAMVPIIQPPIIKLLTTKRERLIRMEQGREVSRRTKIIFPIAAFMLTAFVAPGGLPLLGMLFFGNLLRECLVADRLSKTAQTTFIDIVTILLGVTVGAKTSASNFLTLETIQIFLIGIAAFAVATATGVLFGKLMNAVSKEPVNPMIGAAGVSAIPMAARVVHKMGLDEDKQNFLLMHAMGPNVAGVIGSAVAAGVLLSRLSGT